MRESTQRPVRSRGAPAKQAEIQVPCGQLNCRLPGTGCSVLRTQLLLKSGGNLGFVADLAVGGG
jgi:hypothetical protein